MVTKFWYNIDLCTVSSQQQGHLYKEDAGYFIVNLDRNSPAVLFDHVPQMYNLKELSERQCREDLYCGMPMYYPCASMLK